MQFPAPHEANPLGRRDLQSVPLRDITANGPHSVHVPQVVRVEGSTRVLPSVPREAQDERFPLLSKSS